MVLDQEVWVFPNIDFMFVKSVRKAGVLSCPHYRFSETSALFQTFNCFIALRLPHLALAQEDIQVVKQTLSHLSCYPYTIQTTASF